MTSGRKREFDSEVALDAAMHTFWQKGYVGTSMSDLIENMGINKPSMYRAFGNKESLFIKATQYYLETQQKPHMALLFEEGVPLKQRLKNHMMSIIDRQCSSGNGCYLVLCQSEVASEEIPEEAEQLLTEIDENPKKIYTELFKTDSESRRLGLDKNAKANSLSIYTLLKGTASMARTGVKKSELEYSVDSLLKGIGFK